MMHSTQALAVRELSHRFNDGIDVRLLWDSVTDRVSIVVHDQRRQQFLRFEVDSDRALDAFHHPYAYAGGDLRHAAPPSLATATSAIRDHDVVSDAGTDHEPRHAP